MSRDIKPLPPAEETLTVIDISDMFDVSETKVRKILARMGLGRIQGRRIVVNKCDIIGVEFNKRSNVTPLHILSQRDGSKEDLMAYFDKQWNSKNKEVDFALETTNVLVLMAEHKLRMGKPTDFQ